MQHRITTNKLAMILGLGLESPSDSMHLTWHADVVGYIFSSGENVETWKRGGEDEEDYTYDGRMKSGLGVGKLQKSFLE